MKTKILDALRTKFDGVNDKILSRIADKLANTVQTDEEVATAVEGVTFAQVLESYGDSRANEASTTAVANYEKKHQLKDGRKVEQAATKQNEEPKQVTKEEDKVPAWAQVLINDNKTLKEQIAAMQGQKLADTRKSALANVLVNAPEKLRERYERDFERLSFKDDDDFNGWLGDTQTDIEALSTLITTPRGVVSKPKSSAGKSVEQVNPMVQARIEATKTDNAAPVILGLQQPTK